MKQIAAALAVLMAVAGTSQSAFAQDFKRISSEDSFRKLVVGKRLNFGEDHLLVRRNGKITGRFGGDALKGAWKWQDGFWCRTLTTHSKNSDCQLWEADAKGKTFRVTRARGSGSSFVYTR